LFISIILGVGLWIRRRKLRERSQAEKPKVEKSTEAEDKPQLHGDSLIRYELPSIKLEDPPEEMLASEVLATEMLGSERLPTEMEVEERAGEMLGSERLAAEMPAKEPVGAELTPLSDLADTTRPSSFVSRMTEESTG
jgi:hypothetical protein